MLQKMGRTRLSLPRAVGCVPGGCPCASPQCPAVMAAALQDSFSSGQGQSQVHLAPEMMPEDQVLLVSSALSVAIYQETPLENQSLCSGAG